MFNRLSGWWQLWMMLAVMWTIVALTSGWMNLPRAQHIPHDPQFLSKLSNEALSILRGANAKEKRGRSVLVWSEDPKVVRMWNDARLTFPATTTDARAEIVATEYRELLNFEAGRQLEPYLLKMLAIWLAPLLVTGLAIYLIGHGHRFSHGRSVRGSHAPYSVIRAVESVFTLSETKARTEGDAVASGATHPVRMSF